MTLLPHLTELKTGNPHRTLINHDGRSVKFDLPLEHDHISRVLRDSGTFYEAEFLASVKPFLSPGQLVIDAGANIGNHSLYFAQILGCNVIAYEAVDATLDVLINNIEINYADERIEVRPVALGSRPGNAEIEAFDTNNIGATRLAIAETGNITVTTLDAEKPKQKVSFIKIDVEGMDLEVIRGARELIERDRPLLSCELMDERDEPEMIQLLSEIDYVPLGTYNATPTWILAPARTTVEIAHLVTLQSKHLDTIRSAIRDLDTRLLRSNRYTERLHREALAHVKERMTIETPNKVVNTITTPADAPEIFADQLSELQHTVAALERRLGDLESGANR